MFAVLPTMEGRATAHQDGTCCPSRPQPWPSQPSPQGSMPAPRPGAARGQLDGHVQGSRPGPAGGQAASPSSLQTRGSSSQSSRQLPGPEMSSSPPWGQALPCPSSVNPSFLCAGVWDQKGGYGRAEWGGESVGLGPQAGASELPSHDQTSVEGPLLQAPPS